MRQLVILLFSWLVLGPAPISAQSIFGGDGVFIRLQLVEPAGATWHVALGGYIHNPPWYLKAATLPEGAAKDRTKALPAGVFTEWFDLRAHNGKALHGRLNRAGGVAEFPNVTANFVCQPPATRCKVIIELATAADAKRVVKRFEETFAGTLTSFLVSPDLVKDKDSLETAAQMSARRLDWARTATGGQRVSPKEIIVQTGFWGPQRAELNAQEAEVLWLLGFNVVGNQAAETRERFPFRQPGRTHHVQFGPEATREQIEALMQKQGAAQKHPMESGVPFNFADEICARPGIGTNAQALAHFRAWLPARGIPAKDLGVARLDEVLPIETPTDLRAREQVNGPAARRIFYYTSRFRQIAGTQRVKWHTEAYHRHFPGGGITSTLVADHPYFSGTGLGMGMVPNMAWGGAPLALDWFDLARERAVDLAGIEDWMGLQFMYGPNYTWEGFQLMGFQAAMFRSGSRGAQPIISWITPSDETNLRLKSASALAQGAKHFFYWTYGPTATATENYWSDLRGAYDGVAAMTRQLAAAEHILAPGRLRPTRLAVLYSVSSDLWQPFGYVQMLERRATYLNLTHQQFGVDFVTEEDVEAGRLADYDVLYTTDPCLTAKSMATIEKWVEAGGQLYGACAAGSRNEFNEEVPGLSRVFGIAAKLTVKTQDAEYRVRGRLNALSYVDRLRCEAGPGVDAVEFGIVGCKVGVTAAGAMVAGKFQDGAPAVLTHRFGRGRTVYVAGTPGVASVKDARFVPQELKEVWPEAQRQLIIGLVRSAAVPRMVELSHAVVEAGVYDAPKGTALVLANFTYQPIQELRVRLAVEKLPKTVRSVTQGEVHFKPAKLEGSALRGNGQGIEFVLPLGLNDIVLVE